VRSETGGCGFLIRFCGSGVRTNGTRHFLTFMALLHCGRSRDDLMRPPAVVHVNHDERLD
jgi:hypothetical protein